MNDTDNFNNFDALCAKYSTWIIKYCSSDFKSPLYLIWYSDTDENETDRILTYKSGEIFASYSLSNLQINLRKTLNLLYPFEYLSTWLNNFNNFDVIASNCYDLIAVESQIQTSNFDIPTLEGFTNFVDLVDDYIRQDIRNEVLREHQDNETINEAWNYYYKYIFWPRFNDREKFEAWERPPFLADIKALSKKLKKLEQAFNKNIKPAEAF